MLTAVAPPTITLITTYSRVVVENVINLNIGSLRKYFNFRLFKYIYLLLIAPIKFSTKI